MHTIDDIARILRRDLPAKKTIQEESRSVKNQEDDQWPLDGTDKPGEAEKRWNKWSTSSDDWGSQPAGKRRRLLDSADSKPTTRPLDLNATLDPSIISTNATTMQNSSSFSYVGFTSAASRLQVLEEEATKSRATTLSAPELVDKPTKTSLSTKRSAGQSSLATFFGKKSTVDSSLAGLPATKRSLPRPPKSFKENLPIANSIIPDLSIPLANPTIPLISACSSSTLPDPLLPPPR